MPRRRKTGARGGSPEKQPADGANNVPEGRTMSTSSDDGAGNAAELSPKEREKLVEQLQEMFSKQLDPGVVYIVLAESDFKVEEAMEDLLMLACEADKNSKPGASPSPNVFSQIATELVSKKKPHPSSQLTKESTSGAQDASSSVQDTSAAIQGSAELAAQQASHADTPPTTSANSTAGYYSFYGAPLGFPTESRFSDPSVIAVGTIDYQASSKLAQEASGKSPPREPGTLSFSHSKDSISDGVTESASKDGCPTEHPSPNSRSFPVRLTSTSSDDGANLQTEKENFQRAQNLPSEYSLFGANSPHVANGHAHHAGTSHTSGGMLRQESNVAADFTFPTTLRTDEGREDKLLHRTSLANRKSVGADSPSTRMLKSKKPRLNLKIPFGDENTHIEIYSEIQTPLSPGVFDFDDEKPLGKPETPKVKDPISKAAMEAFQSFVETEVPNNHKDSFDSAEDSDDDAADILFSLPASVRELSPSPETTEDSLQASNNPKPSEHSQPLTEPPDKTGTSQVTDKCAKPNEETASNHSKSSNTENSSVPQSPTEEDNKDQSADIASKSSKSSSSCSSPDKSASAASKSPNLLFKILPRVMNYPSAASSPDTNVEADKEVAEIMEKAQTSKLSVDVPEFVPKQGNLLTPGDFVPPMVPAGHPVPYPSEYAMHFPHPASDPYWHPRFGMPVHPPFFPHPPRMHMYGPHVARFPPHIPMYPARPVVSSPIHPSMMKGGAGSPLVLPDGKSPQIPNENRLFGPPFVIQDTPFVLSDSPFPNQEANMSSKSNTKEEKKEKKGGEIDRRVGSPLIMSDGKQQESDTASEASTDDGKKVSTSVGKKVKTAGPKKLYVLRGCPGSGKSTLAKKLKGNKGVILSTDDFFMKKDKYEFDPSQLGDAHAWNKDRAELAMKVGMTPVIIDNTNTERWEMKPYVVLGVKYGYMIEIREPNTPWKFKVGELSRRNSHGVSKETIRKMLDRYEKNVTVESIMKGMADQKIEQQRAAKEAAKQAATSSVKNKEVAQSKPKQASTSKGGKSVITNKPSQDASGNKPADSAWPFPVVLKDNKKANTKKNNKTKAKKKDAEEEWLKVTHGSRQKSPSPLTTRDRSEEKKQSASKKSDTVCGKETSKVDNKAAGKNNPSSSSSDVAKESKKDMVNKAAQEAASLLGLLPDKSDPVEAVNTVASDWDVGSSPKPQRDTQSKKADVDSSSQRQIEQKTSESPRTLDSVNVPATCDSNDVLSDPALHDSSDDWGDGRSAKPKRQTRKNRLAAVFNKTTVSTDVKDKALKENWSFPSHPDTKDGSSTDMNTATCSAVQQPDEEDLVEEVSTTEAATNTNPLYFSIVQRVQSGTPVGVDDNIRILTGKANTSDVQALPGEEPDPQEETKTSAPSSPKRQKLRLEKGCSTDDIPSERTHTGDLGFLQNCFPSVSVEDLRDFYEKCNHELEWTINILLDSGIEYIEPTKSEHSTEDNGPSMSQAEEGKTVATTEAASNVDESQKSETSLDPLEEQTPAQEPTVATSTPDVDAIQIPPSINIFTGLLTADVNEDDMYSSNPGTAVSTNEESENSSSTPVQENGLDINAAESKAETQSSSSDMDHCDSSENVVSSKQPKCQIHIPVPSTFESDEEYESADEEVAADLDGALLEAVKGGLMPGSLVAHHSRQSSLSSLTSSVLSSTDQEHLSSMETDHQVPVNKIVSSESSPHSSSQNELSPGKQTQEKNTEKKAEVCVESADPCSTGLGLIQQITEESVETCPEVSEEILSKFKETNRPSEGKAVGPTMSELALRMDPQFAKQLLEIFGPVGFHISPGSLSEEDLYVQVDYKTARRIHYKWTQTQKAKFDEQEEAVEAMEAMIKEDEALARKLQEEEDFAVALQMKEKEESSARQSRSAQRRSPVRSLAALSAEAGRRTALSPPALADIMDEQLALEVSKQEQAQSAGPRQDETLATKLKREKLFSMFPRMDKGVLEEIFSANGYKLDPTVNAVVVSEHMTAEAPRNVMTDAALKLYEDQLMEQARIQSQQEAAAQAQASSRPAVVVVDRNTEAFQETEEPDYEDFRTEATIHYKQRQECFQKAATAYQKGQKELAFYYAQQGHLHTDKLREANRRASEKILELKNAGLDQLNCLDLHGLHVNEAIDALKSVLKEKERELHHASTSRHPVANYICVITGRGNNSRGGVARLKPAVLNYLHTNDYRFTEPQVGLVKITLK
ncbi:NEDD4-binding protein 2-like isoform X1 [Branchiostoma floridae]|uniref:NEDD4-binding protein 2-like isoform X1 n=2 Tax=Branchiostoma floridae TaxID=7739 RepID=A0A9J7MW77_BRAFL|nr:NEDD4-binding protein 2-like isoform X1 [Branchiostoma floridae]